LNIFSNLIFIFLILNFSFAIAFGINLRKWYGWAQLLLGFILGYLMDSTQNVLGRIGAGAFIVALMLPLGYITWKRRHP
jgi:hypothetical protein